MGKYITYLTVLINILGNSEQTWIQQSERKFSVKPASKNNNMTLQFHCFFSFDVRIASSIIKTTRILTQDKYNWQLHLELWSATLYQTLLVWEQHLWSD